MDREHLEAEIWRHGSHRASDVDAILAAADHYAAHAIGDVLGVAAEVGQQQVEVTAQRRAVLEAATAPRRRRA